MRSLARVTEAEAARLKRVQKRVWHWCRRPNGFSDNPKWRVVAARVKLPLPYVIAFVNRLEELANDAGNKGLSRGEVVHFSAEEFGLALGMTEEEAAQIFAALEDPGIGWVAYDHIADFYDRNRDTDSDDDRVGAALRQRRKRARADVLAALVKLARRDLIETKDRFLIEVELRDIADIDLFGLRTELSTKLYTGQHVTRDSRCDSVTVTAEKRTDFLSLGKSDAAAGEEPQAIQRGSGEAKDNIADPELWLAVTGKRILCDRLNENSTLVDGRLQRWHNEIGGDLAALREIIERLAASDLVVAEFLREVSQAIGRHRRAINGQRLLPLPPALAQRRAVND